MAHYEKYTMLIVPFALLLVLGSLPQNALGLKCYSCETEKCSDDTEIEECDSTQTVCMGMEFKLGPPISSQFPKDTQLPNARGCFSAEMAACVGNMDNNKCYPFPEVREGCKGVIEVAIKSALDSSNRTDINPAIISIIVSSLDGKICACTTDLCNNEIKEQPATTTPSSGTVLYENLKFHQWIVTFLLAILYSQA